ncbi:hypothetical protein CDV26_00920 [Francisella halioticida]|uniref:Uncharacterized protein n=1 Tax=Francisella halioticida TaxID=549298 RepID=A0ABM6LWX6_9GAMM|nr:hypothetical protein [Francisella halioticida]ASG67134.1 hypothetical protein CDV26_00920 [Francisella halioticida]
MPIGVNFQCLLTNNSITSFQQLISSLKNPNVKVSGILNYSFCKNIYRKTKNTPPEPFIVPLNFENFYGLPSNSKEKGYVLLYRKNLVNLGDDFNHPQTVGNSHKWEIEYVMLKLFPNKDDSIGLHIIYSMRMKNDGKLMKINDTKIKGYIVCSQKSLKLVHHRL